MRTVLIYRSEMLPYSETFIKEQHAAYRAWRPVLVGRKLLHQLNLDGLEFRLLQDDERPLAARVATKAMRRVGYGPSILRKENASLLHAHFGPDAVEAEVIARALDIPLIVTLHGYDINIEPEWWEKGMGGTGMEHYPRRLLKLAANPKTHFIAVSEAVRRRAIAYGIPARKLNTFHIGIDVGKFRPGPIPHHARPPRVLFVGRLVEKKGCEYLLRAMQCVKGRVPEAHLRLIGEGPQRNKLEQLSNQLGIAAHFIGALPADTVKSELDNARVLCLPSVHAANGDAEGFGLVLLEAQAAGLPVVSSAFGGASEGILDGKSGFQFEEKDIFAMADHLAEILLNPHKGFEMGLAGRQLVSERFDLHRCTEKLENFYSDFVMSHAANRQCSHLEEVR
jgi:glucosyltransferase